MCFLHRQRCERLGTSVACDVMLLCLVYANGLRCRALLLCESRQHCELGAFRLAVFLTRERKDFRHPLVSVCACFLSRFGVESFRQIGSHLSAARREFRPLLNSVSLSRLFLYMPCSTQGSFDVLCCLIGICYLIQCNTRRCTSIKKLASDLKLSFLRVGRHLRCLSPDVRFM